jgi:hypothetical protein
MAPLTSQLFSAEKKLRHKWNSTLFTFSLIIEGAKEKVLKFKMPMKSVSNRNFGSIKQKCIYEHFRRVKNRKISVK